MKKLLLTAVVAFCTLFASAQIMVVTTYDGDLEGAEQITSNMGIGYQATDQITAGVQKSGDDYSVFVRYAVKDDIYATFNMPTKDGSDKMQLGLGYSMNVWNNLYFEPSYTMPVKEDAAGDREGSFNFGLAYRF
jgi:opacity protein-like surface antigen|tara:strand:+ start:296 stop:697 length:402 start_codon:yes stop_codon:yes gene_type:complete